MIIIITIITVNLCELGAKKIVPITVDAIFSRTAYILAANNFFANKLDYLI